MLKVAVMWNFRVRGTTETRAESRCDVELSRASLVQRARARGRVIVTDRGHAATRAVEGNVQGARQRKSLSRHCLNGY